MFNDSRLKIRRAKKHITDLDSTLECLRGAEYCTVREYFDPQSKKKFIEYGFAKKVPVNELALIIGDAVHNLKTSLDYSWLHVVSKLVPHAVNNFAKFPIYPGALPLQKALQGRGIQKASPDLYDLILSEIKPYEGGEAPIWAVHRLDISDKHRLLIPMLEIGNTDVTLENKEGFCGKALVAFTQDPRGIVDFWRVPIGDDQTLKDYSGPSIFVVFDQGTPVSGQHVSPVLHHLVESVVCVVETLEAFLES